MHHDSALSRRTLLAATAAVATGALAACSDTRRSGGSTTPDVTLHPEITVQPPEAPTTVPSGVNGAYVPPPTGEWDTTTAGAAGFSEAGLAEVVQLVADSNSTTFTILHQGLLVAEQYWAGATADTTRDVASVQKSFTSTLIGLARDRGLLSLDDPVSNYLEPGWTNARPAEEGAITVRHLLTMTSGLDERTLQASRTPGAAWEYNTVAYQKLRHVLEVAADTDINSLTGEWLFDAIGIDNPSAWAPRPIGAPDAVGSALWGLNLRAREMARFGLFAMRNGNWGGTQITDPGWFAEAWTPIPQARDYGYLWWLLGKGHLGRGGGVDDLVAALGAQDQKIYVIPSLDLVVTRQGTAGRDDSQAVSDFDARLLLALKNARA
ncbi:MAG: serine hydrolase [Actinomycetota bacterium]|nr:serine hydrolase [Actinomycetota bacterium]